MILVRDVVKKDTQKDVISTVRRILNVLTTGEITHHTQKKRERDIQKVKVTQSLSYAGARSRPYCKYIASIA